MNKALTSENLDQAILLSTNVINTYQDKSGAYPASPNFGPYKYCWLRDGSFIADAMSRVGQKESAEKFFNWCCQIINNRKDLILSGGQLDARYSYEGQEATEEWANYQIDGYGLLLWTMSEHFKRYPVDVNPYHESIGLIEHYLDVNWQRPSIDWWEERTGQHAASLACVYAGLNAFNHPTAAAVRNALNLGTERIDASLLICPLLNAIDPSSFAHTLTLIENSLVSRDGGVYRYQEDTYFGGGEWPILTAMLGWYYFKLGRINDSQAKLQWLLEQMQPNGWLKEQSSELLLHMDTYQPWIDKWGESANPLLWSQAMFITLALEIKHTIQ